MPRIAANRRASASLDVAIAAVKPVFMKAAISREFAGAYNAITIQMTGTGSVL